MGENENQNNQVAREKTLIEYFSPVTANSPSCIVLPTTNATHFELKPSIIQLLPSFYGLEREDPYMHVKEFLDICSTFRFQNFSEESVKLRLFPFSLKDKAKIWLNSLQAKTITSWDQPVNKFLAKFFPMSKTDSLRREISEFFQKENEEFCECWERFNDLILKCPHHGFETWRLVKYFYDGLTPNNRQLVQSTHGGRFLHLIGDEAWNALENLSNNSQQWNSLDSRAKSIHTTPKRGEIYEVRQDVEIKSTIDDLVRKVDALVSMQSSSNSKNESCISCVESFHSSQSCPPGPQNQEIFNEEVNALHLYGKSSDSPFAPTYNPNWRNHPNFSWKQNMPPMNQGGHQMNISNQQNVRPNQYPPNNYQYPSTVPKKPTLEDTLQQFMQSTQQIFQSTQQAVQSNSQAISKFETQIGQLATTLAEREKGKFPSQSIPNPKRQYEVNSSNAEVQSITTLRSGKEIQKPDFDPEEKLNKPQVSKSEDSKEKEKPYVPKAPSPERLISKDKSSQYKDILEIFKRVRINIPFLDVIKQVPAYSKFLKDLCTVKRKTNVPRKAFLAEHVSSIIQNKTPVKYKDPGSPTISCVIGDHIIKRALLDLGASVNLLPYSVYTQLGLGELKSTYVILQLADRSIKIPRGIVEDVLIQVDKFYFPVDFIVIDTEPVKNIKEQIPIILGRPFLATSDAIINCRNGIVKFSFGNMTVELNMFNISQQHDDHDDVYEVNMIESMGPYFFPKINDDDLFENCLAHFGLDFDIDSSIDEVNSLLESTPLLDNDKWKAKPEPLESQMNKEVPIEKSKIELNPLPESLKYAFLRPSETLPVIIASDLDKQREDKLINVLKEHKEGIGWTISDLKDISPSIYMHRIYLEENVKTSREFERRLNPNLKEVVRAEIIKLLDVGIIYPLVIAGISGYRIWDQNIFQRENSQTNYSESISASNSLESSAILLDLKILTGGSTEIFLAKSQQNELNSDKSVMEINMNSDMNMNTEE
ncbi:hypothetical protein OROMI_021805 [Orobanche minor]